MGSENVYKRQMPMEEKKDLRDPDEKVVEIELERLRGFLKDDEAVVLMVDSNLQREMISPSEKAFAYKVKYEAIKRKAGRRKCGQVDHNLGKKSIELIGEECGDSPKQVQLHRFFPVTYTAEQMRREILEMLKLNMKKYWDA